MFLSCGNHTLLCITSSRSIMLHQQSASHKEHSCFSPGFKMNLRIDTDEKIEGGSSSIVEALLKLREDTSPDFSQSNSPLQNFTRSGKSKMVSPNNFQNRKQKMQD